VSILSLGISWEFKEEEIFSKESKNSLKKAISEADVFAC
jgi:hypothetical protein